MLCIDFINFAHFQVIKMERQEDKTEHLRPHLLFAYKLQIKAFEIAAEIYTVNEKGEELVSNALKKCDQRIWRFLSFLVFIFFLFFSIFVVRFDL